MSTSDSKPSNPGRNRDLDPKIVKEKSKVAIFNPLKGWKRIRRLEQLSSPDSQVERMKSRQLKLIEGEQLYTFNWIETQSRIFSHYDETQVCLPNDDKMIVLDFITDRSYQRLVDSSFNNIHLGFILIGIKAMHRGGMGTRLYLSLIDSRHADLKAAIVSHQEVSLDSVGESLVYIMPKYICSMSTFRNNIKLVLKSKGYNMIDSEPNIYITKAFVGRITNNGQVSYTLRTNEVLEILASNNIRALDGYLYDSSRLDGIEWIIPALPNSTRTPRNADIFEHRNGSLSVSFKNYSNTAVKIEDLDDEE